ncbi:hypothetical protein D3C72_2472890 [compost metagenome]
MDFALEVPGVAVIDEIRGKTELCELKSHAFQLRPRAVSCPIVCPSSHASPVTFRAIPADGEAPSPACG